MRVRAFTQDDAHIFCTQEQITEESLKVTNLILDIYKSFGFENVKLKFSDRPDKRVGSDIIWDQSEKALIDAIKASGLKYEVNKGEGAFYGPKIEFVLIDAIGREWQCGTLQVDFNLPGRLDATYVADNGSKQVPVMLHRAMFGSLERFIGILIEHHAGKFPFWLAPDQVAVLPISSEQNDYAFKLKMLLEKKGLRSIIDNRNEKINYKIREHSVSKIPVLMICGAKEVQNQTITIRRFGLEQQQTMSLDEAMDKLSLESRTPSI
jgi:threonyl-tRNA synthetase